MTKKPKTQSDSGQTRHIHIVQINDGALEITVRIDA